MKIFYNIIFSIYAIFYLPALLFRGRLHRYFLERFGIFSCERLEGFSVYQRTIWVHAVSVGEVSAAKPVIDGFRKEFHSYNMVISTTTRAGHHLAKYLFSNIATIIYSPLDFSLITSRVARLVKPNIFCMMETELWPNLILSLSKANAPIILLNGRISDRSLGAYMAASPFMRPILARISAFCMQSETDARRIEAIGANPGKITVTGNLKFDIPMNKVDVDRKDLGIGPDEDLIIAGSTHHGEEAAILKVYKALSRKRKNLRLLIAPRHVERARSAEIAAHKYGFKTMRVSRLARMPAGAEGNAVLILDTVGRLKDIYAAAAIVFVGGSLIKKGGHNLVEPAMHARPIVFGPHMFNFRDMSEAFLKNNAAAQVKNPQELLEVFERLLTNLKEREALGNNAKRLIEANSGATKKTLAVIRNIAAQK